MQLLRNNFHIFFHIFFLTCIPVFLVTFPMFQARVIWNYLVLSPPTKTTHNLQCTPGWTQMRVLQLPGLCHRQILLRYRTHQRWVAGSGRHRPPDPSCCVYCHLTTPSRHLLNNRNLKTQSIYLIGLVLLLPQKFVRLCMYNWKQHCDEHRMLRKYMHIEYPCMHHIIKIIILWTSENHAHIIRWAIWVQKTIPAIL